MPRLVYSLNTKHLGIRRVNFIMSNVCLSFRYKAVKTREKRQVRDDKDKLFHLLIIYVYERIAAKTTVECLCLNKTARCASGQKCEKGHPGLRFDLP